jgi:hypothetical protein
MVSLAMTLSLFDAFLLYDWLIRQLGKSMALFETPHPLYHQRVAHRCRVRLSLFFAHACVAAAVRPLAKLIAA